MIGFSNPRHLSKIASVAQLAERDRGKVEVEGSNPS